MDKYAVNLKVWTQSEDATNTNHLDHNCQTQFILIAECGKSFCMQLSYILSAI